MPVILWIFAALLGLFALYLLLLMPRARRPEAKPFMEYAYAHRGLWDENTAENSLSAFAKAAEAGYGIELDVQLSSDGEVMVFHDENLLRMTGLDASLHDKTKEELSSLFLSGTKDTLPTLAEVLDLVGGRVPLLVELKSEHEKEALCQKTAELLDSYQGPFMIESFHPYIVGWFRRHRPSVVRGQLYTWLYSKENKKTLAFLAQSLLLINIYARPDFMAYDVKKSDVLPLYLLRIWKPYFVAWTVKCKEELTRAKKADTVIFERITEELEPRRQEGHI
ncbi:MAG: glycerophosphodiester phosphodiesterase [Clostridia bacterium]|nr:glycerophosphodiester phosphodiesterase [Clostridia bacterium]